MGSGDILFVKKGYSSSEKMTVERAGAMFPDKKVGIWRIGDRFIDVKANKIALDAKGEPRGIILYEGEGILDMSPVEKSPDAKRIIYKGVFMDHGGYANMNREIALRLSAKRDIDMKIEVVPSGKQVSDEIYKRLMSIARSYVNPKNAVNIIGFTPMQTDLSNFNVFFTMMEPETLHPSFKNLCNKFSDHIFTPTQWNKEMFIRGGIKKPIHVIPLGIDEKIYQNKEIKRLPILCRELPARNGPVAPSKGFNFITLFGWSYRKGIDVLLKSYCNAFTGNDDVGLIICSRYMGGSDLKSKSKVESDILKFMSEYDNPPTVYYYGDSTPVASMPNLLKNGDCFVWTSRGEGFGLPVCEAGALEIPVISSFNSGMTEFLNKDNSFLVETDKFVVADRNIDCISPYYVGQLFPQLGKPAINKFSELMRYVYNNYGEAKIKGKKFSEEIFEKYTWTVCAEKVFEVIGKIK